MREAKNTTILVVDDEVDLRSAIVFDFKRKGFQTLEASSGDAAFELLRQGKVDIVLSDIKMAGSTGVELLKQLRAVDPEHPVVMLVSGFAEIAPEEAYFLGADAVISKPFERRPLLRAIRQSLKSREERWSSKDPEDPEPQSELRIRSEVFSLGRGGFFASLEGPPPPPGTSVSFRVPPVPGLAGGLEGNGLIRWVRSDASEKLSAGCGIEILYLTDACRQAVIDRIHQLKTHSFIPLR